MNQKYNVSKKALNALKASIARWEKAAKGILKSLLPKPTNNTCSACEFQASLGITLLDAKYLDPKCWTGCQALVHKHRIEALIEAGNKLRQKAALGQHAEFEELEAWDKAATLEPTTAE